MGGFAELLSSLGPLETIQLLITIIRFLFSFIAFS